MGAVDGNNKHQYKVCVGIAVAIIDEKLLNEPLEGSMGSCMFFSSKFSTLV
jgi:hypothetical protein